MGEATVPIRVLHVDDEPDFADMAAEFLQRQDDRLEIETATSANEGLDRLDDAHFDCIVSDYEMPGTNGIEFLEAVREEYPDLPFVLFTGKGSEAVASDAISAGVTEYMQKEGGTDQYAVLANRIVNSVEQHRAEREAERAKQRLRELSETTTDCLWMFDREWETLHFISGYEEVWERPESAIRDDPRDFLDGVHPDDRDVVRSAMDRLSNGEPIDIEYRILKDDDEVGWVWVKGEPIFEDGEVVRVVGFTRDVTARKERERQMEFFEQLVESLGVGVAVYDRTGEFHYVNPAYAEMFDLSRERVEEKSVWDVNPDFDRQRFESYWESIGEGETRVHDARHRIAGTEVPVRTTTTRRTIQGETWHFGTIQERSERGPPTLELREKAALLDQIFANLPTTLYVKDDQARHVRISEYYLDPDDVIGKTDLDMYPESFAEETYADDMRVIESGEEIVDKEEYNPGTDTWLLTSKVPWYDTDGSIRGLIGISHAITERKEHERELERQNERLEAFASIVSHDLRNPLNVAQGQIELARTDDEGEHLEKAANALDRSLALVDDLLTLAREGQTVGEVESVSLRRLVRTCWETVETADATLRVETDRGVRADESRLQQLLANLLRNAVEHGGEDVTITVGDLEDGFYVADDGPGIPEADRDAVFEAGYSSPDGGDGLGLNIAKEIANAHGWQIAVVESDANGARFEITGVESPDRRDGSSSADS